MRKISRLASVAAAALAFASLGSAQALAQDSAEIERIGDAPNFNGVWQVMNSANWSVEPHSAASNPLPEADRILGAIGAMPAGLGVVEGGAIPYNEAAQERLQYNRDNVINYDPEAACYLPGIPRATYMPHPFQIVQGDGDDILMVYEYASANRVVHMGEIGIPPIDTWMGTSYGRWDGDTLVVTTLAQGPGLVKLPEGVMVDGVTWLDRAGNYLTNHATVTERFTLSESGDHMDYHVTIEDPSVYTGAWTMNMTLYRLVGDDAQLLEFKCVPFSENLLYGDLIAGQGSE